MQCPNCKAELTQKTLNDINLDECESCGGIWFDVDELRRAKDIVDPDLRWMDFEIGKDKAKLQASDKHRRGG